MNIEVNQNDLNRITIKLNNIATQDFTAELDRGGYYIERDAQINAPVKTGDLRKSIGHEVSNNELTVYANEEYAPYVEFGTGIFAVNGDGRQDSWRYQLPDGTWVTTSGSPAQPFLVPAFNKNKQRVIELIKQRITQGVNK